MRQINAVHVVGHPHVTDDQMKLSFEPMHGSERLATAFGLNSPNLLSFQYGTKIGSTRSLVINH